MIEGMIGKKVGMTQIFQENGVVTPVTVIEAGPCVVVQRKTEDKDGYDALQLCFEERSAKHTSKALAGHYAKAGAAPGRAESAGRMRAGGIARSAWRVDHARGAGAGGVRHALDVVAAWQ